MGLSCMPRTKETYHDNEVSKLVQAGDAMCKNASHDALASPWSWVDGHLKKKKKEKRAVVNSRVDENKAHL